MILERRHFSGTLHSSLRDEGKTDSLKDGNSRNATLAKKRVLRKKEIRKLYQD